jgi:hypothetical protein
MLFPGLLKLRGCTRSHSILSGMPKGRTTRSTRGLVAIVGFGSRLEEFLTQRVRREANHAHPPCGSNQARSTSSNSSLNAMRAKAETTMQEKFYEAFSNPIRDHDLYGARRGLSSKNEHMVSKKAAMVAMDCGPTDRWTPRIRTVNPSRLLQRDFRRDAAAQHPS